jgi:hypothetical protein
MCQPAPHTTDSSTLDEEVALQEKNYELEVRLSQIQIVLAAFGIEWLASLISGISERSRHLYLCVDAQKKRQGYFLVWNLI